MTSIPGAGDGVSHLHPALQSMFATQCAHVDCAAPPTHYLLLHVPPIGHPAENMLRATISLRFCKQHAEGVTLDDVVPDDTRAQVAHALHAEGKEAPDFARAVLEVREVGDTLWQAFVMGGLGAGGSA